MSNTFEGNLYHGWHGPPDPCNKEYVPNWTTLSDSGVLNAWAIFHENISYSSAVMSILHHSQDLNVTFATLAKSMTNSIRENSDDNLVMTGKAGVLHVMYQVRWEFLILPIILVFANAVFLVIVIYYTRKSGLTVLGSGAVPTIGLGGSIGPVFDKVKLRSGMEKAAKLQQVRLITSPMENNNFSGVENAATLDEGGGFEMVSVTERVENQENMRRSTDEDLSVVSTISLDSRGA